MFFSSYLTFRPSLDIMFTASDMLFILSFIWAVRPESMHPFQALTVPWIAALGLMLAGLLVGSLAGDNPVRWIIVAVQYSFAWLVLPYVLIRNDRRYIVLFAKALIAGVAAMEAFGALVYFLYSGTFEEARALFGLDFLTGGRRLGAFTADANWNGAAVAMTLPFVYYLYLKHEIGTLVAVCATAILVTGLLLSASFTAFSSVVVGIVIFLAIGAIRLSLKGWFAIGLGVIAAVVILSSNLLPATFQNRVGNALETGDLNEAGTYVGRVELIRDAWRMAEDHLLVGVGADQFRVVSSLKAPVHNMYLLLWVEGGLMALAGWLVMIGILLLVSFAAYRADRLATAMSLSVVTTFLVFSTASPHMYARLWPVPVLLAIAAALQARSALVQPPPRPAPENRRDPRPAVMRRSGKPAN